MRSGGGGTGPGSLARAHPHNQGDERKTDTVIASAYFFLRLMTNQRTRQMMMTTSAPMDNGLCIRGVFSSGEM
jgi:hypothetical protein